MDVCKPNQKQQSRVETKRQPLVPAENKNKNGGWPHTRDVSSRYRSPKRCPSPNPRRSSSSSSAPTPNRATSAERRRPPNSPSTPVQDTFEEMVLSSRGNKLPESLWPSTMRSLSVSFQSDSYCIPVSKREKPVSDRTLRTSRKRSPLKGKNSDHQSENSRPPSYMASQHQWPTTAKTSRISSSLPRAPSHRRLSLDGGASNPLVKSAHDMLMQISRDDSRSSSSESTQLVNAAARALSFPSPGSRAPSPPVSRGISHPCSRGPSPARGRQPQSSASVLSFIADIRKGKKAANHIEDVHQLRMLYNRHLQWRYVNAQTCSLLQSQRVKAERMLYSVWIVVADLWDTVMEKRIELQQLRLKLKLYSVLNSHLTCLHEWTSIERDHVNSLTSAIQHLQATTIRIPVTGGARGDVETVKAAICSAVDVMQAMGSSLVTIRSKVVGINSLVSELAKVAAQEKGMLDECESVLGSTAALQVEEYSLMTCLLQTKQALSI